MVEAASTKGIRRDMSPPDYRYGVQQVRHAIDAKKKKISSVNSEIGDIYAKIESKGMHKKGVKIFATLDGLEPAERLDVIRTLNGMCDVAGWDAQYADLVDAAEGTAVDLRLPDGQPPKDGDGDEGDDDEDEGDRKPPVDAPDATDSPRRPRSGMEALQRSKEKFATLEQNADLNPQ